MAAAQAGRLGLDQGTNWEVTDGGKGKKKDRGCSVGAVHGREKGLAERGGGK